MEPKELTQESRLKLHDIRNHLQVISGIRGVKTITRERLERLVEDAVRLVQSGAERESVEEALGVLRTMLTEYMGQERSLERIYDRIVTIVLSSESDPCPELLALGELVRDEVSYYHSDLRRLPSDRIVFSQAHDAYVRADRTMLVRMLGNLLNNAAEALNDEGEVEVLVDLHGVGEPRPGLLGDIRPGAYATITVKDDGAGLATDDPRAILEDGYSTKAEDSRGFGMSVIRRAVEHAGGNMEVRPAEPRGTLIRIYLPAADPPREAIGATEARDSGSEESLQRTAPER